MKYLKNVATIQYDAEKCGGCGMCTEVCPQGVFTMENKKAVLLDKDLCIECGACKNNCRCLAITVDDGVGCAAAIAYGMLTGNEPTCGCTDDGGSSGCC